ncbi:DNA cytosine methyltransferase [Microbulbifer rhizosphaerae]|uniref:Cytosine-specific methyltransferase n=1 Tax=Microbulbifer rhizosphaerae TaxID=1562603 RepID=A0A7W4W7U2_9GAMM|nr:DNA cytosine methyltransferase [Microbulbifer rhizosphaerae]MBB3059238.1 DNA (cytosine-5)-methyltransferase 1 [Microbulbifer rhizosphaerae]
MKKENRNHTSLSLFTGAGGLDLGLESAGFKTTLCVELDSVCQKTLSKNRPEWTLSKQGDITAVKPEELLTQAQVRSKGSLDLIAGGPPCQPFSKSGYWASGGAKRLKDPRASTLKAYLNVIDCALPKVFILENVKGLAYAGKDEGLKLLHRELRRINRSHACKYHLSVLSINCADYGVPQMRERIFVVGSRIGPAFSLPKPTHLPELSAEQQAENVLSRYTTAWDSIGDLENTEDDGLLPTGKWAGLLSSIPEGQNYQWHTDKSGGLPLFGWRTRYWSFLLKLAKNRPSWTIQAAPGPATGPFHWKNRKLSIRELCRLQTFPDNYEVVGGYRDAHRQIGNAVPPAISHLLGVEIRKQLFEESVCIESRFLPKHRIDCPKPERQRSVLKCYQLLQGNHAPHPGEGYGPGVKEVRDKNRAKT